MKVFIYIICFFIMVGIIGCFGASGYILGAIPMSLLWIIMLVLLPNCLYKLWNKTRNKGE